MSNDNIKDINELRKEKEEREKKKYMSKDENKEINQDEVKEETAEKVKKENEPEEKEEVKEESMEEKYDKLNDSYMRLLADFDNYKKRASKDKEAMIIYSTSKFAEGLFPIIDNFKRALDSEADKKSGFYEGVNMIFTQLTELLKNEGIETIEALDEKFDPNKHYAVAVEKLDDKDDDIILEVFQDGYIYKEKVLRPSMVKVNKLK
ncbi:nucleotide exchange factor GrpE [Anaerofustis stercorihominis]|uniref:nucleotide exchange factor GrpE n=1 Tax=Anaerofustis stercorihominis TaxID=214853 RepID=UPI00214D0A20|nr:nucleotide exchange factor GrpE [Anaerofustis stercorihominis]MCR2032147.1 nucleotide exchange factor GrpE [Anaerofustis stercorihominis]